MKQTIPSPSDDHERINPDTRLPGTSGEADMMEMGWHDDGGKSPFE